MSNQEQISQDLNQNIEQLELIIQQWKAEIDNIIANTRCPQLAHISTRFLTILISKDEVNLRILRQNQNQPQTRKQIKASAGHQGLKLPLSNQFRRLQYLKITIF